MKLATTANYQEHGYITAEYDENSKIGSAIVIVNNESRSFGMEISNRYTLHNIGNVSATLLRPYMIDNYFVVAYRTFAQGAADPDFVLVQNLLMPISETNVTLANPPAYLKVVEIEHTRYIVFTDFPEAETIDLEFVSV